MGLIKIFNPTATSFNSLGLGTLRDFEDNPKITEVLNGQYTLEFEYVKSGQYSEYLQENYIIMANNQPFRIWQIEKDMSTIKVLAKHIFFDLSKNFLEDVAPTNLNAQNALRWILNKSQEENNFVVTGDCTKLASARYVRKNVTDAIFNTDNNLLTRFGGELEYDNYNVIVHNQRGANTNFSIRYGKNLSGIEFKLDFSTVATKLMPVGKDGLTIDDKYVLSPLINNYFTPIYKEVEFSDIGVDENTTEEEAKEQLVIATNQLFNDGIDLPQVSIKIDFIELSKCSEYKDLNNLERCFLGDTITAIIPNLNINIQTRIIKTVYDCLLDRIISLELGSTVPNFVSSQSSNTKKINNNILVSQKTAIEQAQENAKSLINHPFNGNIIIDEESGVLYLIDTDSVETAKNVWKWSLGGLGFSSTGVNGTYTTAITQDGNIVADFITTGKLSTNVIEGYGQLILDVSSSKNQVAQLSLDVEALRSEIGDVTDVTTSHETKIGYLEFSSVNESEPINIDIHPIDKDICYLVISNNMPITENMEFPNRVLQFKNITTNEVFNYELPVDLFISENIYDELNMEYDSLSAKIKVKKIKRIQLNADGTKSILETPTTILLPDTNIELSTGNYEVRLLNYSSAYLFVRLMSQNMYTSQYPTIVKLNSSISQSKEEIREEVNQTLISYSTTSQMNAAIDLKANQITTDIGSTYATKNELITSKNTINQRITDEVNSIDLEVSRKANTSDVNASLSLKVSKDDNNQIVSMLNASAGTITLTGGSKIQLATAGKLIITSGNFKLDANGNMNANNGTFSGKVTATSGTIGGCNISNGVLQVTSANISGTLSANKINGGTITASAINLGNGKCSITTGGRVDCSDIHATGGTIGGFTINNEAIFNGKGIGTAGSIGMSCNISGWAFWAGNGAFRVTEAGQVNCSNLQATGGTIGSFTIGSTSLSGTTTNGTMKIQRGTSACVDFQANGGRLMLASSSTGNVALTTANKLVISDQYSHTDTGDNLSTIALRALNGHIRLASNVAINLNAPSVIIDGYYGQTGQMSVIGQGSSGQYEYYVAYRKGLLVGVSRNPFSTSAFPWLV